LSVEEISVIMAKADALNKGDIALTQISFRVNRMCNTVADTGLHFDEGHSKYLLTYFGRIAQR
jgi:hypothetical protein